MRSLLACLAVACVAACGDGSTGSVQPEPLDGASTPDAAPDASTPAEDSAAPLDDAAVEDHVAPADTAAQPDASEPDVTSPDVTSPDASAPDVTSPDASAPDAATPDASAPDAATPDASAPDASPASCPPPPACNAAPPAFGATTSWRHLTTRLTVALGSARHRGRDLFLREGDPQWALAKFAYGVDDDDLNDEDVDIYLLRDCARWETLGTAATSRNGAPHAAVEGVSDEGGRVYFQIPASRRLGVGWHRLLFVVRGDHSTAEQWINVLPAGARVVVSDVDGTLTESENAALLALLTGPPPAANAGGADMLRALVDRGYHVFYLTARPEWLEASTHQWLTLRGFPRGIVHTTLGLTGATGSPAETFKTAELAALRARLGRAPDYAFGNTASDVASYAATPVPASGAYYYRYAGDLRGGARVDDYTTLVPRFRALPLVCR